GLMQEWQNFSLILKEVLNLDLSPVGLTVQKEAILKDFSSKVRICRAIMDAAEGKILQVSKSNNACFGASWHLGFTKIKDEKILKMIKKFVVEGEKLFSSYTALDNLLSQMEEPPHNHNSYFILAPLEKIEITPQLVIFMVNPESACRLLTLITFLDGNIPKIKIGGPTCRLVVIYPLITGEVNLSFYDYTARKMCNVPEDKLLISIPYGKIPRIVESINLCSAGKAKIEFPVEFRQFLQKTLDSSQ
ncbi:MAG: DUF169 domain-containing protein, partial [Candidatus Omnitrophica bacterium]|nr:DUF169 domain-containing protein [Candidatus Omnitrophota bacterium]